MYRRRLYFLSAVLVLLSIVSILSFLEISARLFAKPVENPRYLEVSASYDNLEQLLKDKYVPALRYHEYYMYSSGPSVTQTVNFTDYFGARATPDSDSIETAKELIWVFGGSTMQNLETEDALSIANNIGTELKRNGIPSRVLNFGTGGFQSAMESIKFQTLIRKVPKSELPTSAVFYDGFNDSMCGYFYGPGSMQVDLSLKMRDLVEGHYGRILLYSVSQLLSRWSVFWNDYLGSRINQSLYFSGSTPKDGENLKKTVSAYVANVRMIGAICQEFQIRCFFMLQPLVVTKTNLSAVEQKAMNELSSDYITFIKAFYQLSSLELRDERTFTDLSHILNGRTESDFYDLGHTSPFAGRIIGQEIARRMLQVN